MHLKRIGLFIGPLAFLLLSLLPRPEAISPEGWKVIAIAGLMISWWITEAVPMAVTALLPMLLLPLLGVSKLDAAAAPYSNPIVYLFMGGFIIALAMERWSLHRRIALNIIRLTGTNADGLLLGFFLATAFISMWISNTATAIMMLPIASSVIELMRAKTGDANSVGMQRFALSMMLGVAYASSIGGMATIIGTPPNVVFAGYMKEALGITVTFAQWLAIGLPYSLLLLLMAYLVIVKWMYPNRLGNFEGAREVIQMELRELGPMSAGEKRTLVVFVLAALCWIFQSPMQKLLPGFHLSDTAVALFASLLLFIIPIRWSEHKFLLDWKDTEKLPWGILLLFGGGLNLADALAETGVINIIGDLFKDTTISSWLVILGLSAITVFLSEVMSNVAQVTIFLPVVGGIAVSMGIPPEEMCIPVTLAASAGFMMPMSTPPNAIVFAKGHLSMMQMARAGAILNIIAILLVALFVKTIFPLVYGG